jgi:FtsH-binding integral membrane protein
MTGIFFSLIGAMLLNGFLHLGVLGFAIALGIGALGVFTIVYSTSTVLRSPYADSPIPGALMLFAGVFNVFVATLSILLSLSGGRRN